MNLTPLMARVRVTVSVRARARARVRVRLKDKVYNRSDGSAAGLRYQNKHAQADQSHAWTCARLGLGLVCKAWAWTSLYSLLRIRQEATVRVMTIDEPRARRLEIAPDGVAAPPLQRLDTTQQSNWLQPVQT